MDPYICPICQAKLPWKRDIITLHYEQFCRYSQ